MLFFYSTVVLSAGFQSEKETRIFSDTLIDQFVNEEFQKGLDSAKPYWPVPMVEIDSLVNKIKLQWPVVQQQFGKAVGKEFIKQERIGKSFLRYYYLHKFEKHAVYWKIDFYRPKQNQQWKINTLAFFDSLNVLFE